MLVLVVLKRLVLVMMEPILYSVVSPLKEEEVGLVQVGQVVET
jgi:hypothetical protein